MSNIIDGKILSQKIRAEIQASVSKLKAQYQIVPGLAVVLVGDNEASQIYVRNKQRACEQVGIASHRHDLSAEATEAEFLSLLEDLHADPTVHGILVQLPLPPKFQHIDLAEVLDPKKDVDGLHPDNIGKLVTGRQGFRSCTPFGIMRMLQEINYDLNGKKAVVIGRSNIVGKPIALMLLEKNATVTICHSRTQNLADEVARADIVVAALGIPEFVKGDWVKPGAVVVDVGINRLPSGKLVGDVEFAAASQKAGWITPVPGGVGPMTITMLLYNTLYAARRVLGLEE